MYLRDEPTNMYRLSRKSIDYYYSVFFNLSLLFECKRRKSFQQKFFFLFPSRTSESWDKVEPNFFVSFSCIIAQGTQKFHPTWSSLTMCGGWEEHGLEVNMLLPSNFVMRKFLRRNKEEEEKVEWISFHHCVFAYKSAFNLERVFFPSLSPSSYFHSHNFPFIFHFPLFPFVRNTSSRPASSFFSRSKRKKIVFIHTHTQKASHHRKTRKRREKFIHSQGEGMFFLFWVVKWKRFSFDSPHWWIAFPFHQWNCIFV